MGVVCFGGSRVVIRVVVRCVGKILIMSDSGRRQEWGFKDSKTGHQRCVGVSDGRMMMIVTSFRPLFYVPLIFTQNTTSSEYFMSLLISLLPHKEHMQPLRAFHPQMQQVTGYSDVA